MAIKTFACPNCTCIMPLPQFDGTDTTVTCIACKAVLKLGTSAKGAPVVEVA